MKTLKFLLLFSFSLFIWSCDKNPNPSGNLPISKSVSSFDNKLVIDWNETFCSIERYANNYRPTPAPRALAYIGLATYEACINGMPDYQSLETSFSGLKIPDIDKTGKYHWPTVYNSCYATLMRRFFPLEMQQAVNEKAPSLTLQAIEAWNKISVTEQFYNSNFESEIETSTYIRSKNYGVAVADAVFQWSNSDNASESLKNPLYGWTQSNVAGAWTPTQPGPAAGMYSKWGEVRTFADQGDKRCKPPTPFSEDKNSTFYGQAYEVYAKYKNLTPEDKWIADFWSDDLTFLTFSPPSRWIAIADQVFKGSDCTMEKALITSAQIGMALHDAAVCTWASKYHYNLERPESYIKRVIDPNFEPLLHNPITGQTGITPSFPAYPSGHATFGAAAGTVLKTAFGSYAMSDKCHDGRAEFNGKARAFNNFDEMIDENGLSRLFLGVHWRMDSEEGIRFGRTISQKVLDLPWTK